MVTSTQFFTKLTESVKRMHETAFVPFRANRTTAISEYSGEAYSVDANKTPAQAPFNNIALMVDTYVRSLIAKNPKTLVRTYKQELRPYAFLLEGALNYEIRRMDLAVTLADIVKDAMFGMGIAKVGVSPDSEIQFGTEVLPYGRPFVDVVSLDEYFVDMNARRWDRIKFEGNTFFMELEDVHDSTFFHPRRRKLVSGGHHNLTTTVDGQNSAAGLSRITSDLHDDMVRMAEVFLPRENGGKGLIIGYCYDQPSIGPLYEREWEGPAGGPYHKLMFNRVPDNLMPTSPVARLLHLQKAINVVGAKAVDLAQERKKVIMVASSKIAESIQASGNMEFVQVANLNDVREVDFNGADADYLNTLTYLQQSFSRLSGNLDVLGGLSSQSDTVGQEQLLAMSSSRLINQMQSEFVRFTTGIVRALAHAIYYDPLVQIPVVVQLREAGNLEIMMTYEAGQMKGDFLDYNFEISPYSMDHTTPQVQLQSLRSIMASDILPIFPLLQQQGIEIDMQAYLDQVARLSNTPLDEIIRTSMSPESLRSVVLDPSQRPKQQSEARPVGAPPSVSGDKINYSMEGL